MGENTPTHEDSIKQEEEIAKRKTERGSDSPELKRLRKESNSGSEEIDEGDSDSSEKDEREQSPSDRKDRNTTPKKNEGSRSEKAVRGKRPRSRSVEKRSPSRSRSPLKRRSKSPGKRWSRSPELKRRRDDRDSRRDRDRSRNQSKDHGKNGDSRRDRRSPEKRVNDEPIEDGEVKEPPRQLSKRELERLALLKQLEEEEAMELNETSVVKKELDSEVKVCPYLDTIDRTVLDFDFEKLCCISLSTMNVYACMICGKYYQGRGTNTHAYTHSLDLGHRVFLNLQTLKFYCLPDNYEIQDPSLEDIKYVLKPTYTKALIGSLDKQVKMSRAYDDSAYFPGIVGLNNIKANDYCNVILHALSHVVPLRNYFLQEENYINIRRPPGDILFELPKRFGELMRKLWNPRAFRKHVSPHEMLQAAVHCSEKRFQITEQSDASEFMTFLLNTLHSALNGTQKTSSSIIYKTFRGRMRQYARPIPPAECTEEQARAMLELPAYREVTKEFPFLYLSMDLPAPPLYRDNQMENVIPQVPLQVLLSKFNGATEKEYKTYKDNIMKRFEILRLPEYLIVTYKRFTKNQFFVEKNPTIVNFPITNVDMYDCLAAEVREEHKYTTYDLIANIVHDGTPDEGTYRAQILHHGSGKWYQMEDLHVEEILPQVIVLAEAYIQVWRLNRKLTREQRINEEEPEAMDAVTGLMTNNPFNPQLPPKVKPAEVE